MHHLTPSPRQLQALLEYAFHGDQRQAAQCMEIKYQTIKDQLWILYQKLEVHGSFGALRALNFPTPRCYREDKDEA